MYSAVGADYTENAINSYPINLLTGTNIYLCSLTKYEFVINHTLSNTRVIIVLRLRTI